MSNQNAPAVHKDSAAYLAARDAIRTLLESHSDHIGGSTADAILDGVISALAVGGEPVGTLERRNGGSVHALLPAAGTLPDGDYALYPHLVQLHPATVSDELIETIAKEWDGCTYEGVGADVDIGQAIRESARKKGAKA